jgi:hypothetical protein
MVDRRNSDGKLRHISPATWALIVLAATAIACACGGIQNQVERAMGEAASEITVEVPTVEMPTLELGEPTEEVEQPTQGAVSGGGTCDPRAAAIQPNASVSGHIDATDQGYPANCTYYCLWLPGGENELDVTLSNFSVDLDLYMVYGPYDDILNSDPDSANWLSNEFGTDDEMVSIPNPGTDAAYYIEICSYEGEASDFTLATATR